MKLIKKVDIMNNKKAATLLNIAAIPILILFVVVFGNLSVFMSNSNSIEFDFYDPFIALLLFFPTIIIHEAIHGLFFKLFNFDRKVKFGFKNGMAYATSPGSYYSKGQFAIIGIAPFVIITTAFLLFLLSGILTAPMFVFIASIHAAGCVGDFYFLILITMSPKNALCEDTEDGLNFYIKI